MTKEVEENIVSIKIQNGYVNGVDTTRRAMGFREWVVKRKQMSGVTIPILKNIKFEACEGEKIGIIGRNGCGKSSLLKVISGNYPLTSGSIKVKGSIFPLIEMGAGFEPELNGRENIKLSYAIRGRIHEYTNDIEQRIIDFSELGSQINQPLKTYSSGMVARLAFSSAIMSNSSIMLLDEILSTGDGGFQKKSSELLKSKITESAITIVVSHSLDEIKDICNRFVLIHNGSIISDNASGEILNQYQEEILGLEPS